MASRWNYDAIKWLSKATKGRITDLIALAPQNDPFYMGTPADKAAGEWFAELWKDFGYTTKAHLRRIHYRIVSNDSKIRTPNGLTYENTEQCWDYLSQASKVARYLDLVSPNLFDDKRNQPPILPLKKWGEAAELGLTISGELDDFAAQLPDFPELPDYDLEGYHADQRYHLEIWCEKSTMDDILIPICQAYGVVLVRGVGELSITATLEMVKRMSNSGKPARIFYISDFDPAGKSMPVAVSRKAEFFIRQNGLASDIRLFPIVLTEEQVKQYRLPRIPIKETEKRRGKFEERFGAGATELDALEALHPGELRNTVMEHITRYYDTSLDKRVADSRSELNQEMERLRGRVISSYQGDIDELMEEYHLIQAELSGRLDRFQSRLSEVWQAISDELEAITPELEDYPIPQARTAKELSEGLYNSQREYLDQIASYKTFQGKDGALTNESEVA